MLELCKSLRDGLSIGAVRPPPYASLCGRLFYRQSSLHPKPYALTPRARSSIGPRMVVVIFYGVSSKGLVAPPRAPGSPNLPL